MIYFCCDNERRRNAVRESLDYNGIDFLEVSDDPTRPFEKRQRTLFVHFIEKPAASPPVARLKLRQALEQLTKDNVRIDGGERIRNLTVTSVTAGSLSSPPMAENVIVVEVAEPGDFSTYTLRLVTDPESDEPPAGFDVALAAVNFSFKVACPADIDCQDQRVCPPEPSQEPEINYLAKDYASFRQLMLDRLALLAPRWKERNTADLGIMLVELSAYVGDYLSYQQDAVATESYLGTARRRTSIRRHARLIDYPMHDGRNARAWIHFEVSAAGDGLKLKQGSGRTTTRLITNTGLFPDTTIIRQPSLEFERLLSMRPQVFELMHDITLYKAHNEMKFYTWGATDCCLAKGSTKAALDGEFPNLHVGDVLLLVEKRGARTGVTGDADPARRHAVRITKATLVSDPLGGQFTSPPVVSSPVTEIEWARADPLPFALCISARVGTDFFSDVGVAYGNIALADHGMTFTDEPEILPSNLDEIATSLVPDTVAAPNPALTRVIPSATSRCDDPTTQQSSPRYRPRLVRGPLTQAVSYDQDKPARFVGLTGNPSIDDQDNFPTPSITLKDPLIADEEWTPARDLVSHQPSDKAFVVEVEADGAAYLRFGDGIYGARPAEGVRFLATYRIGNGADGNVGRDTIRYLATSDSSFLDQSSGPTIIRVSNPLSAVGGLNPETIEEVRQNAPGAFRIQERAVTPADYEALTIRKDVATRCGLDVQRAAATVRWTGSWHTVFVTADRFGGLAVDSDFEDNLRACLERFRMAGQDLEVDAPTYVPLEIEMAVCVQAGYFFSDIQRALLDVFSNRTLTDGRLGLFHPDNFTFGQPIYLSSLISAGQSVTGVDSVVVKKLQRQRIDSDATLKAGKLELGRLEIARLDNDPNFPERGSLKITHG